MAIAGERRSAAEEESESVFVSTTDLTVSFLFVILILLAFFAAQFEPEDSPEEERPDQLVAYLEEVASVRTNLLERVAERIEPIPGIRVTVVADHRVIRFEGDLFRSGEWRIQPESTADRMARAVSDALYHTLPCYTRAAFDANCNATFAAIETILIEGHADSKPLGPKLLEEGMLDNRDLSARRGAETMRAAADRYRPELRYFLNLRGQPVLSFAGYGKMRPIDQTDSEAAVNRRIDIRFIFQTPQNLGEVEEIRRWLTEGRPNLPAAAAPGANP